MNYPPPPIVPGHEASLTRTIVNIIHVSSHNTCSLTIYTQIKAFKLRQIGLDNIGSLRGCSCDGNAQ